MAKELPFVVIAPQLSESHANWNPKKLRQLIHWAISRHNVDPKRIYLTGLSIGGRGTYAYLKKYGKDIAAAIVVCGAALIPKYACKKFSHLEFWAFHGMKDRVKTVTYQNGLETYHRVAKCDHRYPPKFTHYANTKHDAWTKTYANLHGENHIGADGRSYTNIYEWMLTFSN